MKLYKIANWDTEFENHRSRGIINLQWVVFPIRMDTFSYSMITAEADAAEILGVWSMLVQIAARTVKGGKRDGSLLKDNGRPHDANSIGSQIRIRVPIVERALEMLASEDVGWIIAEELECSNPAPSPRTCAVIPRILTTEGKGTEEKRTEEDISSGKPDNESPREASMNSEPEPEAQKKETEPEANPEQNQTPHDVTKTVTESDIVTFLKIVSADKNPLATHQGDVKATHLVTNTHTSEMTEDTKLVQTGGNHHPQLSLVVDPCAQDALQCPSDTQVATYIAPKPSEGLKTKASEILNYLNVVAKRNFRPTPTNLKLIEARLKGSGIEVDEVKKMIDRKVEEWAGTDMEQYLRPETLFCLSKFDSYYDDRTLPVIKNRTGGRSTAFTDWNSMSREQYDAGF